jgi:diguanylate cyclase (GGDEF)-like protein
MERLNSLSTEIIKNYDLLKEIGILDHLQAVDNEINSLTDLLEESIELFNKRTIIDLINYLTKKMLNKFVPTDLAFIIQDEFFFNKAKIICFKNMQEVESMISIDSLNEYRKFFVLSPTSITFEAFEVMFDDKKLTDVFLPLNPEILVPMMGLDEMYGFIVFGKKILEKQYTKSELKYIDWIMKFASVSLQNNIHYLRANVDLKTGLYNHAFFLKRLDEEIARLKRHDFEIAMIMFDIDFFKKINDTYGHLAGDKILLEISKMIGECIRDEDIASRFGGEEFAVLLVQCKRDYGFEVAERVRQTVEGYTFEYNDKKIKVTISAGVSSISKDCICFATEIIQRADTALYTSKTTGRNKTTLFTC